MARSVLSTPAMPLASDAPVDDDILRIELTDVEPRRVLNDLRWTAKAKFPGTPRGRAVVVFQLGEQVVAISAYCPHEHANLSDAAFVEPYVLQCPMHQVNYDLRTGAIKTFKVELDGDRLYLLWKRSAKEPVTPDFSAPVRLRNRREDDRVATLEREISMLREAAATRERQMIATLQQMDQMIQEVEAKRDAMETANAKLASMNEFVARVTDTMSEALIVLDPTGLVRDANRRVETLLGRSRDELLGQPLALLLGEGIDAAVVAGELARARGAVEREAPLLTKDHESLDHLLRAAVLYGPSGKREGVVVVGTDIRLIKAAERRLQAAYDKVANLLDNMRQAVFVVTADGTIIDPVSRYATTVFGYEIAGKSVFDVLYGDIDRRSETWSMLQMVMLTVFGADDFQWDLMQDHLPKRIVLKRGEPDEIAILKVDYSSLRDEGGQMDRLMILVEDVTRVERLEQERSASHRQTQIVEELAVSRPDVLRSMFASAAGQVREARRALDLEEQESRRRVLRELHTLKGNARVLGLSLIARAAHEAESAVCAPMEGGVDAREQIRQHLAIVQRQIAEYGEVAERVLRMPNDLGADARLALHRAAIDFDARCAWIRAGEQAPPEGFGSAFAALRDAVAQLDEVQHGAVDALGLRLARHAPNEETAARLDAVLDQVVSQVIEGHVGARGLPVYGFAGQSWRALYSDLHTLTRSVLRARGPEARRVRERAVEAALSNASELGQEYLTALLTTIADGIARADEEAPDVLRGALREAWRHLGLHTAVEALVVLRAPERGLLREVLRTPDAALLEARVREGSAGPSGLLSFLVKQMQEGCPPGTFVALLQELFEVHSSAEIARMFVSDDRTDDVSTVVAPFAVPASAADIDARLAALGVAPAFLSSRADAFHYLKRLDVMRLLQAARDLAAGRYELLFERVPTVDVMAVHIAELTSALDQVRSSIPPDLFARFQAISRRFAEQPVLPTLYRYYPMVSDILARLGKEADFRVVGDPSTSASRASMSALHGALTHLLRNAVDHGMETVAARVAAHKPARGLIEIECRRAADGVTIRVRDDGRGIDVGRLVQKAIEAGVITEDRAASLSPEEALELVFAPHVSTAEVVTDISGRGIGMDAVRSSLDQIGAETRIVSRLGHGTEFVIKLNENL